jgi:serine/threonine-protein kinase
MGVFRPDPNSTGAWPRRPSAEKDAEGRAEYRKRFMLEAKAAGKLSHASIVTVYDFGELDGLAYMAMELIEGTDLRKRVQQGAIPPMEAVEIACQVAEGLAFAHQRGIVHRDIKPANTALPSAAGEDHGPGLARRASPTTRRAPGLCSARRATCRPTDLGQPVDHRSDVSCRIGGEMLTGRACSAALRWRR